MQNSIKTKSQQNVVKLVKACLKELGLGDWTANSRLQPVPGNDITLRMRLAMAEHCIATNTAEAMVAFKILIAYRSDMVQWCDQAFPTPDMLTKLRGSDDIRNYFIAAGLELELAASEDEDDK